MQILTRLALLGALSGVLGVPRLANAQRVQGTVTARNEQPVGGVVLLLIDARGAIAGRALSGERGEFRLIAPFAGSYHLRTLRIGFTPVTSAAFHLDAGQERNESVRLTNIPYTLEPARVTSRSVCPRTSPESLAIVFAAWEQVRTALYAATLTVSQGNLEATTLRYSRMLDRHLSRVLAQRNDFMTAAVRDPWSPVAPDTLHERGYVRTGADDSVTYAAPSIDALASDSFFSDHCFSFATGPDDQRRIVFEPSSDRRRIPEVRGTAVMDRESSELRRVEYSYVNLSTLQMTQAGGEVEFARLRSGEWLIPRWSVRMPVLGAFAGFGSSLRVTRMKVDGGQLLTAVRRGDTLWRHPLLVMSGQLLDSVTRQPVADAHLILTGTKLEATTQRDGSFRISEVLPGEYVIQVRGPGRTYAGMVVAIPVAFTDSVSRLALTIPTAAQVAASICGSERAVAAVAGLAVVTGHVDATLLPEGMARAVVTAEWPDVTIRFDPAFGRFVSDTVPVSRTAPVDERGEFHFCFVPTTARVTVHAAAGEVRALRKTVRVPEGAHFARVELVLDSDLEPVTTLAGLVLEDSANHPIAGVEIALPDLGLFGRTDDRGIVRISDIPLGTHRLQLRHDGYVERDTVINLERGQVLDMRMLLRRGSRAESGIVSGMLTDVTGQPFRNARIQLDTLPEARSGIDGKFIVRGVPGGARQLQILALGMRPLVMTVDVRPADTVRVSAVVDRPAQLEAVWVVGTARHLQFVKELHERQKTGQGSVMDSTEFGRQATMAALMAGFNSVHVQNTSKSARAQFVVLLPYSGKSCVANIWIDRILSQPDDFIALHPEDLAVVELFPYRLSVPLEFTNPLSDCGAVVVWTKVASQ